MQGVWHMERGMTIGMIIPAANHHGGELRMGSMIIHCGHHWVPHCGHQEDDTVRVLSDIDGMMMGESSWRIIMANHNGALGWKGES